MSSASAATPVRPSSIKRNSSQGIVTRGVLKSPGSDFDSQPLRHQVRPKGHARIVLPRNHSSGRNLAKLARQVAAADNATNRAHARQRSHEGDTEIRLPGSLDESEARPPPIRRNNTSSNLPRNTSHTKLKKNLSHGHLHRLGTARDLVPLTSTARAKTPLSPGLKGKSKRPRSMDWDLDQDLHTREVELARQQKEKKEPSRKIGFAVGSVGDDDERDQLPAMDGSGLDEGEWTEESASASPYSTRLNTANNSRRESTHHERPPAPIPPPTLQESSSETDTETDNASETIPRSLPNAAQEVESDSTSENSYKRRQPSNGRDLASDTREQALRHSILSTTTPVNPTAQLLRRQSSQVVAPALISNVNVMDDARSMQTSPPASLRSSRSNVVGSNGQDPEELVSRFVPSTSNGSGTTTTMQNTPKSGSFHTPDDHAFHRRHHERNAFSLGPVSPGSTVSGSSGATTPAMGRSRIELRMLQEKALVDMEVAAERGPLVPAHVYDRRNESLKSYLQLAALANNSGMSTPNGPLSLGPEIFQGRFKAVNTELKVVQMFKDPIADSVHRIEARRSTKASTRPAAGHRREPSSLRMTKSAVTLPVRTAAKQPETTPLSTSISPPKEASLPPPSTSIVANKPVLTAAKSSLIIKPGRRAPTRGVSFAGADERKEFDRESDELSVDDIARELWNSVMT